MGTNPTPLLFPQPPQALPEPVPQVKADFKSPLLFARPLSTQDTPIAQVVQLESASKKNNGPDLIKFDSVDRNMDPNDVIFDPLLL